MYLDSYYLEWIVKWTTPYVYIYSFSFLDLQWMFRNKALDEVQYGSLKRGRCMKFGAVNVRAIFVFHLTISTHVFYCRDGSGWCNFDKISLSKKICIFVVLFSISIIKLCRFNSGTHNYRKWERIIFMISWSEVLNWKLFGWHNYKIIGHRPGRILIFLPGFSLRNKIVFKYLG